MLSKEPDRKHRQEKKKSVVEIEDIKLTHDSWVYEILVMRGKKQQEYHHTFIPGDSFLSANSGSNLVH